MRKYVIQVREGRTAGWYAAAFNNGPVYTPDIRESFKYNTREEADNDCMPGEIPVVIDCPSTKKLIEDMREGANFINPEEVYSDERILAAADRLKGARA